MHEPHLLDVVRLKGPAVGYGLGDGEDEVPVTAGDRGTIVEEFDRPEKASLVELANDYGETTALVTLTADKFEVVWRLGIPTTQRVGA